jgi:predicted  nucleic acid-binding Zn-ribbon protein
VKDAQPESLARLLELQEQDSAIRLLEHRRDTLPEARRLDELNEQLAELGADLEIASKQRSEVGREQARIEGEVGLLEQKIQREEQRLFSGSVANPRELSSLQAEVEQNRRKRSALEDELLEVMVQRDQADDTFERLTSERADKQRAADDLGTSVAAALADIEAGIESHARERDTIAAGIPDDLLALYERTRAPRSGVGVAALVGGTCQGCHTKLPAREAERMRREGGLQRCDNCGRILVVGGS